MLHAYNCPTKCGRRNIETDSCPYETWGLDAVGTIPNPLTLLQNAELAWKLEEGGFPGRESSTANLSSSKEKNAEGEMREGNALKDYFTIWKICGSSFFLKTKFRDHAGKLYSPSSSTREARLKNRSYFA